MGYFSDDEARQRFVKILAVIVRRVLGLDAQPAGKRRRRATTYARQLPAPPKSRRLKKKGR